MRKLIVHNGDQYSLSFIVKKGGSVITPEDVTDLRISVGGVTKSYLNSGGVTYDTTNQYWLYPLTEEQTQSLQSGVALTQVGVKCGDEIIYSDVMSIDVLASAIREDWTNNA